jgi:molecular chaperone DnaJ
VAIGTKKALIFAAAFNPFAFLFYFHRMPDFSHYHEVLGVPANASQLEIKKAYRRLAMRFHPDKNPGNALAEKMFRDITTAYEALLNQQPGKIGQTKPAPKTYYTENHVLQESAQLKLYVDQNNPYLLDYDLLFFSVDKILTPAKLDLLSSKADQSLNLQFIQNILSVILYLPRGYCETLLGKMQALINDTPAATPLLTKFMREKKQEHWLGKYGWLITLGITVLLCVLAVWLGKEPT